MEKQTLWLNRTLCDVFREIRELDNTKNYSSLLGLINEAQSMANRMEAALGDIKDYREYREKAKKAHEQYVKLQEKINNEASDEIS